MLLYKLKLVWDLLSSKVAAAGAAVIAVATLIVGYKLQVKRAKNKGKREGVQAERERVRTETIETTQKMEEKAGAIREEIADADDHELADRLRKQQSRLRRR